MTTDIVEKAVIRSLLLRFRKKQRWKMRNHPLISQKLLKNQFHKLYED